jgi:hypothetical protein
MRAAPTRSVALAQRDPFETSRVARAALLGVLLLVFGHRHPRPAHAQDLGHRFVGALGLDAGAPAPPGVYVGDRLLYYTADRLRDRHGAPIAVEGLDIDALGEAVGVAAIVDVPALHGTVGMALALPLAKSRTSADQPEAEIDRFGLGDVTVKPLQLGWRFDRARLLTEYTLYFPTGRFEPRGGGLSQGQIAHQFSLGGQATFDRRGRSFAGALVSYDLNQTKIGFDVRRGATVQVQGGLGARPSRLWELGFATYALFQVRDDTGAALPATLRGARDRVFGLGPEVAVRITPLRALLRLRYQVELGVRSRPMGQLVVLGLTFTAEREARDTISSWPTNTNANANDARGRARAGPSPASPSATSPRRTSPPPPRRTSASP